MASMTEAEFTALYQANYPDVLRFVRRRAHPLHVDDIVGETFLAAWRRRDELPRDARPWLFVAARNAMLNSARGSERQDALAVRIADATEVTSSDQTSRLDDRIELVSAWRALPAADQEVLALGLWEDLGAKDAAAVLGCSSTAYAMRLSRAKRALRALLTPTATGPVALLNS